MGVPVCDNAAMPFGVGSWEMIVLGVVVLLIFSSSKVPKMARDLGRSLREVRETIDGVDPRKPLKELDAPPPEPRDSAPPRA
jgi:TatA/E family protein of Tat protein translocase